MAHSTKKEFSEKVMEGFREAHRRLLEKAKENGDELVIVRDGKPVRVKARDL